MKKEGYKIYKITSPDGKIYIGKTCKANPEHRWNQGRAYKDIDNVPVSVFNSTLEASEFYKINPQSIRKNARNKTKYTKHYSSKKLVWRYLEEMYPIE